jgi:hypothetical protein
VTAEKAIGTVWQATQATNGISGIYPSVGRDVRRPQDRVWERATAWACHLGVHPYWKRNLNVRGRLATDGDGDPSNTVEGLTDKRQDTTTRHRHLHLGASGAASSASCVTRGEMSNGNISNG